MLNPFKTILAKLGYHKVQSVKRLTPEVVKKLKHEMWDDVAEEPRRHINES